MMSWIQRWYYHGNIIVTKEDKTLKAVISLRNGASLFYIITVMMKKHCPTNNIID